MMPEERPIPAESKMRMGRERESVLIRRGSQKSTEGVVSRCFFCVGGGKRGGEGRTVASEVDLHYEGDFVGVAVGRCD